MKYIYYFKKSINKPILALLLILSVKLSFGQDNVNELKIQYDKASKTFPNRLDITLKYARALFFNEEINESFRIINNNLKLAKQYSDGKYALYLHCVEAMSYMILDELELSRKSFNKAKEYYSKTNDLEAKAYYSYTEGWLNVRNKNEPEGAKSFLNAIKLYEKVPESTKKMERLSGVYRELVAIYAKLNELELQEKYSLLAIQAAKKQNNNEVLFDAYMTLGYMYENKLQIDENNLKLRDLTEKYYLLAFNLYNNEKSLQLLQSRLSFVANNLANLYYYFYPKSYHEEAKQFALLANEVAKKNGITDHIAASSGILSEMAIEENDLNKGKQYLLNALYEMNKKPNSDDQIYLAIYKTLSDLSEIEENYSEALKYLKSYNQTYQRIYDQDKLEITKKLEAQFEKELQQQKVYRLQLESEKKEQQIQLMYALDKQQKQDLENLKLEDENQRRKLELSELESETRAQELKLSQLESENKSQELKSYVKELRLKEKNNRYYVILIIAILLFLIVLIYVYWQRVKSMRQNQKLHTLELEKEKQNSKISTLTALLKGQEDERSRLARDLHDGLGGLLSGTKIQLTNLNEKVDINAKKDLSKSINQLDGAVDKLRRVAHNLMPDLLVKYGLQEALREYANRMSLENLDISVQFLSFTNTMDKETQLLVYRIIQELVNNAIKHASPSQIIIQVVEDTDKYYITVEDNGIGFDINYIKQTQSAGLHNIQSRVEFLKGDLTVQSEENLGTSFEFNFPKN